MEREPISGAEAAFSEKDFYLGEFRGRTLALAVSGADLADSSALRGVLADLAANGTQVVVLCPDRGPLDKLLDGRVLSDSVPSLPAAVWRRLSENPQLGIQVENPVGFLEACHGLAIALSVFKLIWIDSAGGMERPQGGADSFVHLEELQAYLGSAEANSNPRLALLEQIRDMLEEGVSAVNLCRVEELADELFTYAGAGTLFTRQRYIDVRRLGITDFDAANHLIARGVDEGYLAPRAPEEMDRVLTHGFGAFVEGRHLAGIAALLPIGDPQLGEIVSLYTLTRFLGEGVGDHLVAFALERARAQGFSGVFACTTSARVGAFFERHGFACVDEGAIPGEKWAHYDPERRAAVRCFLRKP